MVKNILLGTGASALTWALLLALIHTAAADVSSTFTGGLTSSSPTFIVSSLGGSRYYQALQLVISQSGSFTFTSSSSLDTYGFLYSPSFDPTNSVQNVITYDDDGAGSSQFRLQANLVYGRTYILVVTTYQSNMQGSFVITSSGPGAVGFLSYTTSTPRVTSTAASVFSTTVSGALSSNSPAFSSLYPSGTNSRYQAFQMTVYTAGTYSFTSSSSIDLVGFLYTSSFNPSNPTSNFIVYDDDSGPISRQFRITTNLQYGQQYVLVVAAYSSDLVGSFSIITNGPSALTLTPLPGSATSGYSPSYSGYLSSVSPSFIPSNRPSGYYYYQAIQVTVSTYGAYTFQSSSSTALDTYGYLYYYPFDPSRPESNMMTSDDDGAGAGQFLITRTLSAGQTYVLVISTFSAGVGGSYAVRASGPGLVSLTAYTPSTARPIRTTTTDSYWSSSYYSSSSTVGIIVGCTVGAVFLVIISVVIAAISRSRQQTTLRFHQAAGAPNRTVRVRVRPTAAGHPNTVHVAYINPVRGAYVHNIEEAPPSYESVASFPKGGEQNNNFHV